MQDPASGQTPIVVKKESPQLGDRSVKSESPIEKNDKSDKKDLGGTSKRGLFITVENIENKDENSRHIVEEKDKSLTDKSKLKIIKPIFDDRTEIRKYIFSFLLLTPSQITTLKLTSKLWKETVEEIPYLYLNNGLQRFPNRAVMAIAPVNSSGDMYHLLAFTILTAHDGKQIPWIMLGYDQPAKGAKVISTSKDLNTGEQVKRSINIACILGYGAVFKLLPVKFTSGQPTARQSNLEKALTEKGVTHYIDNRMATCVIVEFIRMHGLDKTTTILRRGFDRCDAAYLAYKPQVDKYVNKEITTLINLTKKNKKPTIIFHYRYSDKANSDQGLSSIAPKMAASLKSKYNLVGIYADSRQKGYMDLKNLDIHMRPFQDHRVFNEAIDLGKLCHLRLLLKLLETQSTTRLAGIVGNTSGTLDLAALIGHKVFNIHSFGNPIDYQDYRLMIQSMFFTIQDATEWNIAHDNVNFLFNNLQLWLGGAAQPNHYQTFAAPTKFTGLGKVGFAFLSSVFMVQDKRKEQQDFIITFKEFILKRFVDTGFLDQKQAAIIRSL